MNRLNAQLYFWFEDVNLELGATYLLKTARYEADVKKCILYKVTEHKRTIFVLRLSL
jgi:hypothetical protein